MSWEIISRGLAALAVEQIFKPNSPVHKMSKKELRTWVENKGMAKLAVERILGVKRRRFFPG